MSPLVPSLLLLFLAPLVDAQVGDVLETHKCAIEGAVRNAITGTDCPYRKSRSL